MDLSGINKLNVPFLALYSKTWQTLTYRVTFAKRQLKKCRNMLLASLFANVKESKEIWAS